MDTLVYYAKIPERGELKTLFPETRNREIVGAKSEKVKREKHAVWQLLDYALEKELGKSVEDFAFIKTESGKWQTDGVEFSLSHGGRLVAVALSLKPVGVDVEKISARSVGAAKKLLSKEEFSDYLVMSDAEKTEYFIRKWTEKESLFKREGGNAFWPDKRVDGRTVTEKITVDGEEYFLTVAVETGESVRILKGEL